MIQESFLVLGYGFSTTFLRFFLIELLIIVSNDSGAEREDNSAAI